MLFSVIIPAYNAQATILRCLNSIYTLPVKETEYEVIVIDDCSTDDTVETVNEFGSHHSNLRVLLQPENHRQGAARNRGLSIAIGKYIVFLDSDDEIEPGILPSLSFAEECDLEITTLRVSKVCDDERVTEEFDLPYSRNDIFTGIELQENHPFWCTAPWGYIYLRSFIEKVGYPFHEDVVYEDTDFILFHLYHSTRTGYSDELSYRVHNNPESTTNTFSYGLICDYALLGTRLIWLYNRIDNSTPVFADTLREGGIYRIMKSFRSIFRLKSFSDIRAFYDRFDSHSDRKSYLYYIKPAYRWSKWSRFCLKHRKLTILIVGIVISTPLINCLEFIKKKYA